jgi:hypothetical protein
MSTVFDPTAYADDEDIVAVARADFAALVSDDEDLARGSDGVFQAGTPWVLSSASVDFAAQGVAAGNVMLLSGVHTQPPSAAVKALGVSGQRLIVDQVAGSSATLRRVKQPAGFGHAPGSGGLTGVVFRCCTLSPQIRTATDEIRRELDFDVPITTLLDADDLKQLCVAWVLADLYLDRSRLGSASGQVAGNAPFGGDVFALKYSIWSKERDALLERLRSRRLPLDAVDSIPVVPID